MGDVLDGVGDAMGVVVGWINAPVGAGLVVGGVADAVEDWVAQVDVGRGHVDLRPQAQLAIGEFAGAHPREQLEALLRVAPAPGAVATGFGQTAAIHPGLLGAQGADIGAPFADQLPGECVQLLEIRRGIAHRAMPAEAEPADVVLDGFDKLLAFLEWIGVVEAEVAMAAIFFGEAEIEADRPGVADVQIAVGLRRKPGMHPPAVLARGEVPGNHLADEAGWLRGRGRFRRALT